MAQNITLMGASYTDVPAVTLPKTGGGTARFDDASVTTATASDVASGKYFLNSSGVLTQGTASGGGTDFIVTFTEDQNGNWSPDCTFADIQAAFTAGKTISTVAYTYQADEPSPSYGYYNEGDVAFYGTIETFGNNKGIYNDYVFDSNGFVIYNTYEIYDTYDATALPADVANGKIFYNANGRQTGTASGGGGSSMNVQVAQSTTRASSSSYTNCVSLTCSAAGTYDVYWSCFRSSTGGTNGSQLYVGGSAYGTANTTFTNHIQNNHLTGVTLAKNQSVAVYARSRGSNYYAYVGTLTIKQTA